MMRQTAGNGRARRKRTKALGLCLALVLLLLLAACGRTAADPVEAVLGYEKSTVFFRVNGEAVTAEDYLIWLVQELEYMHAHYLGEGAEGIRWEERIDGITAGEYLKGQAKETAKLVAVIRQTAESKGFRYDAGDGAAYEQERAAMIEAQGGAETYARYLLEMCVTDAGMERVNRSNVLYRKMLEGLFAPGGAYAPSEASIREELDARNILRAKHILFLTAEANLDAKPYSAQKIAEQRSLAEQLSAVIRDSSDPQETFEQLMHQYSEDSALAAHPEGYFFTTMPDGALFQSRMVEEFEAGTMALAIGQISGVVESSYGLHIILRLDPLEDEAFLQEFLSSWNSSRLDKMLQDGMNSAQVEETEAFRSLDARRFYEALLAYRLELGEALPQEEGPEQDGSEERE